MDGLLIVDKPEGLTSADVVRRVKRTLRQKIGHLGTLDPFATGVLPVCIGQGTKLAPFLSVADKRYQGTIRLGTQTDTADVTGTLIAQAPLPCIGELADIAAQFLGDSQQIPPMYSALKRDGVPLYKLARRGEVVEREPRAIRIDHLRLTAIADDLLEFDVACSKGTYVRVLAEDIARVLGTVGHLHSLRRVGFGDFDVTTAISLDSIVDGSAELPLIGLREALRHLPELTLDPLQEARARRGERSILLDLPNDGDGEHTKLIAGDGALVAVLSRNDNEGWRYARVFER